MRFECGGGAKRGFAAAGQQQKFSTKATLLGFRVGLGFVATEKFELFSLFGKKPFFLSSPGNSRNGTIT